MRTGVRGVVSVMRALGMPDADWLDLSTGINPHAWSAPTPPPECWHRLPDPHDGLLEAARAYGMSRFKILYRIWLPHAIQICLPTLTGEIILLLKSVPLVSTIAVMDLLKAANIVRDETFLVYEPLLLIAGAVALRIADPPNLRDFRYKIFDGYQRLAPREYQPAPVVVIDIDEETLERYGQWPWPRTRVAELVDRLRQAGAAARGADAYVTLEPCSHHGQTGPCSEALIAAGVARVVSALEDPDPRVSGRGHAALEAAGIPVTPGICAAEARADHAGFFARVRTGRPAVTLKLAASFDGRIATGSGQSQWITGPEARRVVHGLRATHDAVMVGGGTARADDPALTVRDLGVDRQPVRVVVSRRLDLSLMSRMARTAREVPVWICHGPDADPELRRTWEGLGARLLPCDVRSGQLDAGSVLEALGAQGLTRVLCEGGGMLAASLLEAGLVDRLVGFTAGLAIGAEGLPAIGAMGLAELSEAPRFSLREVRAVGTDVMHVWGRADGTLD